MTLGHIMGIPFEETVLALAPVGALWLSAMWIAARELLRRRRPLRPRSVVAEEER